MSLQFIFKNKFSMLVYVEADHALEAGRWDGVLYALGDNLKWKACSGPHGKGPAPKGQYEVFKPTDLGNDPGAEPYRDKKGHAWFAKLAPAFKTERSGFGIHPDGNIPGTLGCIGITEEDSQEIYEYLKKAEGTIFLFVV